MKKLLIIGHGRHGKDTTADMLSYLFGHKFKSSSQAAADIFIYDFLRPIYGYGTPEECYADRHNHRKEWYDLICEYNAKDKTALAREIMKHNDIYVGMRSNVECKACVDGGIFDLVLGVFDPRKPLEDHSSMDIDIFEMSDIIIPNSGTLEQLQERIAKLEPLLIKKNKFSFV